jgi:Fuc2NAc and GlcNAc transferase
MPGYDALIFPAMVLVLTYAATGCWRVFALRTGLLDHPTQRSSHTQSTPRGGGAAIVLVLVPTLMLLYSTGLLAANPMAAIGFGGSAIALIGFVDDRHTLSARSRICVHAVAALLAVAAIRAVSLQSLIQWGAMAWFIAGLEVLAVIWSTNLFNFMDGIDGIAASEAIFVAGAGAWLNWSCGGNAGLTLAMLCLSAANCGFLLWNWPPSKIFMGDVGSGFVGFMLAALALAACTSSSLPGAVWVILGGIFVVDATFTLLRRMLRGDRWFEAHRTHAYQWLARRWKGHRPVTLLTIGINICWLLPWAWFATSRPQHAALALIVALSPLAAAAFAAGAGRPEN